MENEKRVRAVIRDGSNSPVLGLIDQFFAKTSLSRDLLNSLKERASRKTVIAVSLVDAYEIALQRTCNFSGEEQGVYITTVLESAGWKVAIVSEDEFAEIIGDTRSLGSVG